jgi:hypothetical protein
MSSTATRSNPRYPASVEKYLLPHEELVTTTRRHPAVLLVPSAQAVGGLFAVAVLQETILHGHSILSWIAWALWGVLMARLVWNIINWAVDYFVITSDRILLTSGVFTQRGDDADVQGDRHELPPLPRWPNARIRRFRG